MTEPTTRTITLPVPPGYTPEQIRRALKAIAKNEGARVCNVRIADQQHDGEEATCG